MSKILIWKQTAPGCEYDIFTSTDYRNLHRHVQTNWGGICKNWGNRLWFQGIYSAIDTGENDYDFITEDINIEQINSSYDMIILPMANIFYHGFRDSLQYLATVFEKVKIPIYIIACGVQADSYDSLNEVISSIGEDSTRFIRAIYNTGGEFALRGYITKEFFNRLGFHSAVVTGCPSIYQFGPAFTMEASNVDVSYLNPVFNGRGKAFANLMEAYPSSVFMDQDEFFDPLFNPEYLSNPDLKFKLNFISQYGVESAKLLAEGRIRMFADMNDWWNYLQNQPFNYSFGSRIHGTIMAILSGIPATIVAHDSRTREMAEFFDIPMLSASPADITKGLFLDAYEKMDYSSFNTNFAQRFNVYEQFLVTHGIVSHANTENKFFTRGGGRSFGSEAAANTACFDSFYLALSKQRTALLAASFLRKAIRRVF